MTVQPPQQPGGGPPYPGRPDPFRPGAGSGPRQWTTPPAPGQAGGERPIRTRRVFEGIGSVLLVHLFIAVPLGVMLTHTTASMATNLLLVLLVAEGLLFVGCLVTGIVMIVRHDRGLGIGIMIGWAISALVMPVVGFGLCVAALQTATTA